MLIYDYCEGEGMIVINKIMSIKCLHLSNILPLNIDSTHYFI